jgi:hypothetical protein
MAFIGITYRLTSWSGRYYIPDKIDIRLSGISPGWTSPDYIFQAAFSRQGLMDEIFDQN